MAILPVALAAAMVVFDQIVRRRRRTEKIPARFRALLLPAFASVLSHPLLDFLNTYGVRFLYPFSKRWFYGDTLFIVDPWVWIALAIGIGVSRMLRRRDRVRAAAPRPDRPRRRDRVHRAHDDLGLRRTGDRPPSRCRCGILAVELGARLARSPRAVAPDGGCGREQWLPLRKSAVDSAAGRRTRAGDSRTQRSRPRGRHRNAAAAVPAVSRLGAVSVLRRPTRRRFRRRHRPRRALPGPGRLVGGRQRGRRPELRTFFDGLLEAIAILILGVPLRRVSVGPRSFSGSERTSCRRGEPVSDGSKAASDVCRDGARMLLRSFA